MWWLSSTSHLYILPVVCLLPSVFSPQDEEVPKYYSISSTTVAITLQNSAVVAAVFHKLCQMNTVTTSQYVNVAGVYLYSQEAHESHALCHLPSLVLGSPSRLALFFLLCLLPFFQGMANSCNGRSKKGGILLRQQFLSCDCSTMPHH